MQKFKVGIVMIKNIHQMWLGPDKIPEEFQHNVDLIKDNNSTYTHYFLG